jgi:transposase
MICGGFLSAEDCGKLVALARDGSAPARVTRRANALVLLDGGWSAQEVADALLMNDDMIRGWHILFEQRGIEGLTSFDTDGSAGFLNAAKEDALKAFVATTLPRSTREVGAFIEREFSLVCETGSGLLFADAVHPTHAARPVGCWTPPFPLPPPPNRPAPPPRTRSRRPTSVPHSKLSSLPRLPAPA